MSKSTIEIKTAFEGCAEVCTYCDPKYVAIKIDINATNIYECRHINWCMGVRGVINKLSEQTADKIVRCKDCKYSRVYALDSNEEPRRWCVRGLVKAVDDDDYCSWGE